MINNSELRIGNWALYPHTIHEPFQITEPRHIELAYLLKPIPLSPEVLEACGFYKAIENDGNLPCWKRGKYTVAKWVNDRWQMWIQTVDIFNSPQTLHRLQNIIFELAGEDLKVNLEKVKV